MERKAHWEEVYTTRPPTALSWFQSEPVRSLELIEWAGVPADASVIDVGGGDSTFVDALLDRGHGDVTVLDLSGAALARARERLGPRADVVTWLEGDVTRLALPPARFDLWHDRAVFHFLTDPRDRARYVASATSALRPGAILVLATFAPDGPTRCSGLDVVRYGAADLEREMGAAFVLVRALAQTHRTPSGGEQRFTWTVFRRR